MDKKFIMTAFGKDRPGIVADIAEVIFENHCNLEDSNMGRLADEFTLILLLSGKGEDLGEKLSRECRRMEREKEIFVFIRPLEYSHPRDANGKPVTAIRVEGIDQAGIVYKVSRLLAENNINIETLKSRKKYSPGTGTAMYDVEITATLPETVSVDTLEASLDTLGSELNVDITVS